MYFETRNYMEIDKRVEILNQRLMIVDEMCNVLRTVCVAGPGGTRLSDGLCGRCLCLWHGLVCSIGPDLTTRFRSA